MFDLDTHQVITIGEGSLMYDRTAYWIARPATPERAPRKTVAIILVALTLVVLVVCLSGNAARPSSAAEPISVSDGAPKVENPGAFSSMLEKIMSADANLGQAAFYAKQYPNARVWQANYDVMVRSCLQAVSEYDAAASKYTLGALSDHGLPSQVDIAVAPTDCRPPTP